MPFLEMVFNANREEVNWVSAHLVKLSENTNRPGFNLFRAFGQAARIYGRPQAGCYAIGSFPKPARKRIAGQG